MDFILYVLAAWCIISLMYTISIIGTEYYKKVAPNKQVIFYVCLGPLGFSLLMLVLGINRLAKWFITTEKNTYENRDVASKARHVDK